MKFQITACIANILNSFREEVYVVAFFKVVQKHTVGEVANSITCVRVRGLPCGANVRFGGFPYTVYPGRPEWSKVQTRGKPLVATAQATYASAAC